MTDIVPPSLGLESSGVNPGKKFVGRETSDCPGGGLYYRSHF